MSLTITTDVFCDAPDCLAWVGGTTGERTDATGARRAAKMHGWARRNRKDLCPEHADRLVDDALVDGATEKVTLILGGGSDGTS